MARRSRSECTKRIALVSLWPRSGSRSATAQIRLTRRVQVRHPSPERPVRSSVAIPPAWGPGKVACRECQIPHAQRLYGILNYEMSLRHWMACGFVQQPYPEAVVSKFEGILRHAVSPSTSDCGEVNVTKSRVALVRRVTVSNRPAHILGCHVVQSRGYSSLTNSVDGAGDRQE